VGLGRLAETPKNIKIRMNAGTAAAARDSQGLRLRATEAAYVRDVQMQWIEQGP